MGESCGFHVHKNQALKLNILLLPQSLKRRSIHHQINRLICYLDDIFSYLDLRFINQIINKLRKLELQTWVTDVRADLENELEIFN